MDDPRFFIVSGTSGSGKTIALQVLEDLGFYCIDNLPASLIPEMASRAMQKQKLSYNCAISIDSRNQDFIGDTDAHFSQLEKMGVAHHIMFIDADDKTLLKRYSETRRKHPLSDKNTSLQEAIAKERAMLEGISRSADWHINTSHTTPHELRSIIRNQAVTVGSHKLTLLFQSFGFKYGTPTDTDFIFDVRCLPNPHWHEDLKPHTGLDQPVQEFLAQQPQCEQMFEHIRDFIAHWLPCFIDDNRNYITVAIGCTGGKHRSVYLADRLRTQFNDNDIVQTQIRHREL